MDNDGDDLADCADPDCAGNPACPTLCTIAPTFASIECRLAALLARIETTPDIQSQRARLVVQLTASRQSAATARTSCGASDAKGLRKNLAKAGKRLKKYVRRLRTKAAKKTLPVQLRVDLGEAGDALRSDVKTLRATAVCPGDAIAP
jgi:hypothetical protein